MNPTAKRYFSLTEGQQKQVQIWLCRSAYEKWLGYVLERKIKNYQEYVCGTVQVLDHTLPKQAINAVEIGQNENNISYRYQEPIAALQDGDLEFTDDMELAYYSIYNLFNFHIMKSLDDSWLIVNQALAGLGEESAIKNLKRVVDSIA